MNKVTMEEIRSWYEVPSIAHFCSLFRAAFNLSDFDIEELEDGLLASATIDGSTFVTDLVCRLLNGCYGRTDIVEFNFEHYLNDILKIRYETDTGRPNPMEDIPEFRKLPLRTKVEVIHELCNFRLDADDVMDLLKGLDGDGLRVEPLGIDNNGSTYWYFYGTRLYREDPPPPPPPPSTKKRKDKKKSKHKAKQKDKKKKGKHRSKAKARGKNKTDRETSDEEGGGEEPVPPLVVPSWCLVCSTLEQWEELTQKFKGAKTKCERDLYKALRDDFLPEMPALLEEKEKALKRKLLELAPKRSSSRIERKKAEREEQERIMKLLDEEEKRETQMKEEARRKICEAQRLEERRVRQEERDRVKEDRAKRARLREERAEYLAQGLELPPHLQPEELQVNSSVKSLDLDEDVIVSMFKVLESVKTHKDAWPFLDPVSDEIAPGYSDYIETPMDLSTIEKKLTDRDYKSRRSFIEDFELIFENCRMYNGPDSDYTEMARSVQKFLYKTVNRYLPLEECESDEEFRAEQGEPSILHKKYRPQRAASSRALETLRYAAEDVLASSRSNSPFSQDETPSPSPKYASQRFKVAPLKGELGAGDSMSTRPRLNPLSTEALIGYLPRAGNANKTATIPVTVQKFSVKSETGQPSGLGSRVNMSAQPVVIQVSANTMPSSVMPQQVTESTLRPGVRNLGSQSPQVAVVSQATHTSLPTSQFVAQASPVPNLAHPGPKHKLLQYTRPGMTGQKVVVLSAKSNAPSLSTQSVQNTNKSILVMPSQGQLVQSQPQGVTVLARNSAQASATTLGVKPSNLDLLCQTSLTVGSGRESLTNNAGSPRVSEVLLKISSSGKQEVIRMPGEPESANDSPPGDRNQNNSSNAQAVQETPQSSFSTSNLNNSSILNGPLDIGTQGMKRLHENRDSTSIGVTTKVPRTCGDVILASPSGHNLTPLSSSVSLLLPQPSVTTEQVKMHTLDRRLENGHPPDTRGLLRSQAVGSRAANTLQLGTAQNTNQHHLVGVSSTQNSHRQFVQPTSQSTAHLTSTVQPSSVQNPAQHLPRGLYASNVQRPPVIKLGQSTSQPMPQGQVIRLTASHPLYKQIMANLQQQQLQGQSRIQLNLTPGGQLAQVATPTGTTASQLNVVNGSNGHLPNVPSTSAS